MKAKHLLFAGLLLVGFASCKKDKASSVADNTFSWTIDGKDFTSKSVVLSVASYDGDSSLTITGQSALDSTMTMMQVEIDFHEGQARTGTFTDSSNITYGRIEYIPMQTSESGYNPYISDNANLASIKVTRSDAAYLEGTFSGKIPAVISEGTFTTITNGKFKINRATVTKYMAP